jgi:hypothetical protein
MRTFEITYGSGLACPYKAEIEVEDFECEQDAVGKLIDMHEANGDEGLFIPDDEIHNYGADLYITGGNHSRHLYHHGVFEIRELEGAING